MASGGNLLLAGVERRCASNRVIGKRTFEFPIHAWRLLGGGLLDQRTFGPYAIGPPTATDLREVYTAGSRFLAARSTTPRS